MTEREHGQGDERSTSEMVAEFYQLVGRTIRTRPTLNVPDAELRQVMKLLNEEVRELQRAFDSRDVVKAADGLGDIAYVIYGAALQLGIDLDRVVGEIHEANMSKPNADGSIARAEDGKILRGDSYRPPQIERALDVESD